MVPKLFLKPTIQIVFIHSFSTYSYNKFSNLRIRTSLAIQNYFAIYFRRHKTTCQTHLKVSRLLAKKIFFKFRIKLCFCFVFDFNPSAIHLSTNFISEASEAAFSLLFSRPASKEKKVHSFIEVERQQAFKEN